MTIRAYLSQCGTTKGYATHVREGSRPCFPCKQANNEYSKDKSRAAALTAALDPADPAVLTLDIVAEDVPALAAAALDRAIWLEKDDGSHNGSQRKALRLRHLHKQLSTWHRNHDSKDTTR